MNADDFMDTVDAANRSQDKDDEIERLKQSRDILSDLLYKMEAKANNHEDLITELCDALEGYAFLPEEDHPGHWETSQLLQRAREATL